MAKTKIEWADKVWNPVTGCTKISEGCWNCYAERMSKRLAGRCGYPEKKPFKVTVHIDKLEEPLRGEKPQRIFVCSMGDLFHSSVPMDTIRSIFWTMLRCRQHTFLLLTKRPERAAEYFQELTRGEDIAPKNIWLGVTVENQQAADERIPILLQIPAAKRFISIEPMLGPVDLKLKDRWCDKTATAHDCDLKKDHLNWVILGGETGPKARPLHPDWVRSVRDQCQAAGVPFFFKQWGEWAEDDYQTVLSSGNTPGRCWLLENGDKYDWFPSHLDSITQMMRVGKKAAGHLLDGKEYRELPE